MSRGVVSPCRSFVGLGDGLWLQRDGVGVVSGCRVVLSHNGGDFVGLGVGCDSSLSVWGVTGDAGALGPPL